MKKILTIALVAVLAVSTAFAGISGNASVSLGYDTTSKEYGMKNGTSVDATFDITTDEVEKVGEGDIYAGIKASMSFGVAKKQGSEGLGLWVDGGSKQGLGLWLSVDEAYVAGSEWKLSILSGKGAPDYAKSAIDKVKTNVYDAFGNAYKTKKVAKTYSVNVWKKTGVTLSYKGYTVAAGFAGNASDANKYFAFNFFAETKAFEFEGGSFQAAAIVARDGHKDADNKNYIALDKTNAGVSLKADYAKDEFSADVAADFGLENFSDLKVNFDAAAKIAYSPVALDVYFLYGEKLLSAQVTASFDNFTVKGYGKDVLVEDNRNVGGSVEATFDAFKVSASAGITLKSKEFSSSASVEYKAEKFTANAGVGFGITFGTDNTTVVYATASVESEVLIPGATLSLAYDVDSKENDMNFLKDQKTPQNFGAITAKCKIAF